MLGIAGIRHPFIKLSGVSPIIGTDTSKGLGLFKKGP
jgi:hypothetical protein